MTHATIEVVGVDMMCFKARADTLEPLGCCYYEPAAWTDPQGRQQMSVGEWNRRRSEQWEKEYRERLTPTSD